MDKYGFTPMIEIGDFRTEWLTSLCDFVRDTEVPLLHDDYENEYVKILGYIVTRDGNFGTIVKNSFKSNGLILTVSEFILSHSSSCKFISFKHKEENIINMEVPANNGIPDFVALNNKLKKDYSIKKSIFKAYINAEIVMNDIMPSSAFAGTVNEWIAVEGLIKKINVNMEVE